MEQYLNGVRYLEPSHVIQKYLDSAYVALSHGTWRRFTRGSGGERAHNVCSTATRMKDKSRLEAILSNDQIDFS